MPPKVGPVTRCSGSQLWMLLCLLLGALVLAAGTTLSPVDLQSPAATPLREDWASTTVVLQPDLQTEAQTQTEGQTDAQTEPVTDTPTQRTTGNYTGEQSAEPVLTVDAGNVQKVFSCMSQVTLIKVKTTWTNLFKHRKSIWDQPFCMCRGQLFCGESQLITIFVNSPRLNIICLGFSGLLLGKN